MSPIQRSRLVGLCLVLAMACLLGFFAIMNAASAQANQGEQLPPYSINQPHIVITPTELLVELLPDEQVTQTLWITNSGDVDLNFTIIEMTGSIQLAGSAVQANPTRRIFQPAGAAPIDPLIEEQARSQGSSLAIIYLRENPDLSAAYQLPRTLRGQYVYNRLVETASHSQELFKWLEAQGTQPQRLLTANAIAATVNPEQLEQLVANPLVRKIAPNHQNPVMQSNPSSQPGPQAPAKQPDAVEWNIAKIRADEVWSNLGITGEGVVVGILDTGVMYDHPALVNAYRGNLGLEIFDHNYNWFDFVDGQPTPYDDSGHGSMVTGVIVGDDTGENQIGVAPGADWMAAKACAQFACSDYATHAALQWMLAPTDLTGANPDPTKAPRIVIGGWGSAGCDNSYEPDIEALRAAGILVIFPSGATGPSCSTIGSPADLPVVLTAGATDQNDIIGSFSPRGPSCYAEVKPDVTAPGVEIRSSINNGGYAVWSGTSLSSAHAAGTAALILSADPSLGTNELEDILYGTAVCIQNLECGGDACPEANNVYGHGRIDAYEAVSLALGNPPQVDLPWLSEMPISATLPAGEGMAIQVRFDSNGLEAGSYTGALGILSDDPQFPITEVPVTLTVTAPCTPVVVNLVGFRPSNPTAGEVITFTAVATGTLPITYTWSFGDGTTDEGEVVTHSYTNAGLYLVNLAAENGCGSQSIDFEIFVGNLIKQFMLPLVRK